MNGKLRVNPPVQAYRGEQPYVFLCWSHEDTPAVHEDLEFLASHGINVWYDEGISAGSNWRGEIAKRIEGATCVLYYVSRTALASDHCNREINFALDNRREVVPVYLEPVELTPDLKVGLARVHALHRSRDPHFRRHLLEALTPTSSSSDQPSEPFAQPAAHRSTRAPVAIALSALAVVVGAGLALWHWQAGSPPATPAPPPTLQTASIAVLPFANLSGDAQDEYFGDGVAEEILNALSRVEELRVAARTSAFSFKGKNVEVREIGKALGVANVLEGSVRRDGERMRINTELVDATSGFRVWSSSFDRDVHDVFAVQDEIASAVAKALQTKLSVNRAPGETTSNIEAYNALLKGRALTTYARDESSRAAIGYLKQAIALDPGYGAAYGELAIALALSTAYVPFAEVAPDWSAAFTRALEINPRDADALAAKANYVTLADWDWQTAGALYRRANDIGLSSKAAILYGTQFLEPLGKSDEMRAFYRGVLETDPFNVDILWDFGVWSTLVGRPEEALSCWNRLLEIEPGSLEAWTGKASAYAALRDAKAARAALEHVDVERLNPYMRHEYLHALWLLGERDEAAKRLAQFEAETSRGPGYRAAVAWSYVIVGERSKALDAFEAAYAAKELTVLTIRSSPLNAILRDEPRYAELLRKMHLDDESLRTAGFL